MKYSRRKIKPLINKKGIQKKYQLSFRRWLFGISGGRTIQPYIGADVLTVREHIQSLFLHEMSWNNYGEIWVLDHIVPCRLFDMMEEREMKLCWNYKNVMPLLKSDNLYKEGEMSFALNLLSLLPQCEVVAELRRRAAEESQRLEKYLIALRQPALNISP
jgi:hypothetical protein